MTGELLYVFIMLFLLVALGIATGKYMAMVFAGEKFFFQVS